MKLSTRGFTLVELMIVIAIIGILAAALFPSLTSYLARGRDTSRIAGIKDIATAIANYSNDNNKYPAVTSGCITSTILSSQYLPKFPKDPTNTTHCTGGNGQYGYGTGTVNGSSSFALSALLENPNGGNTGSTISSFQGDAAAGITASIDSFSKGTGNGYVNRY